MKRMLTVLVMIIMAVGILQAQGWGQPTYGAPGTSLTGGVTYFSIAGDDWEDDEDQVNALGFRVGADSRSASGAIFGVSYIQKGVSAESSDSYDGYSYDGSSTIALNYFSGHVLFPVMGKGTNLEILIGGEVGYFYNMVMSYDYTIEGYGESESDSDSETTDREEWVDGGGAGIDYGALAGVSYHLTPKLGLTLSYFYGLAKLEEDFDAYNRGFNLYLSLGM